jgi:hypothetical protein
VTRAELFSAVSILYLRLLGGRSEVALLARQHTQVLVIGMGADEKSDPSRADDPDGPAPTVQVVAAGSLVQVPDDQHRNTEALG